MFVAVHGSSRSLDLLPKARLKLPHSSSCSTAGTLLQSAHRVEYQERLESRHLYRHLPAAGAHGGVYYCHCTTTVTEQYDTPSSSLPGRPQVAKLNLGVVKNLVGARCT